MSFPSSELVRASLARAGFDAKGFARDLKSRLFERDPSLKQAFAVTGAATDTELLGMLTAAVKVLDDDRQLAALARNLATRHGHARVQPRQYGVIGQALLDTLAHQLGASFTEDVRNAWVEAYVRIAEAVMAARYNPMDLVA